MSRRTLELASAVAEAERELGSTGRVLLRPSGTEPVVRDPKNTPVIIFTGGVRRFLTSTVAVGGSLHGSPARSGGW
ncbi:hypothetical protein ABTZ59_15285 [Streptomyces sp. NPDC094034]|uniref:hypothetical protein n=1 Tax=Streptomyces sp. NPDC094034 TaxID=3155309 RepID=UPI00332C4854